MKDRVDIVMDAVRRFPNAGAMTIAKKIYNENFLLWKDVESCRSAVRAVLGQNGKHTRLTQRRQLPRPARKAGENRFSLPDPWEQMPDWGIVDFECSGRSLILSDIHIPYYHKNALQAAIKCGKDLKVNTVLLNGDIADCHKVSWWQTDPTERRFSEELACVRQFLSYLRSEFKKARIIYKLGNHEERLELYLMQKAPEIFDIPEFKLSSMLDFSGLGIIEVKDMRPIRLGGLIVIHGHEYKGAKRANNPISFARTMFLKAKLSGIVGHSHQTSQFSEPNIEGKVISNWSTGCLCARPRYAPLNFWNHGFAWTEHHKDGWQVHNPRIINGRVYD